MHLRRRGVGYVMLLQRDKKDKALFIPGKLNADHLHNSLTALSSMALFAPVGFRPIHLKRMTEVMIFFNSTQEMQGHLMNLYGLSSVKTQEVHKKKIERANPV